MNTPAPCAKCSLFGGSWMETETGLKRCDCPRGRELTAKAKQPEYHDPVISTEQATLCTEMMAGIQFFPPEEGARAVISNEIAAMCESDQQARWLAMRMVRLYRKWPGVIEMRIVFCSTYQPLDALAAIALMSCTIARPAGSRVSISFSAASAFGDVKNPFTFLNRFVNQPIALISSRYGPLL